MSLHFYTEKEDYLKEESINKYKNEFIEYIKEPPTLSDALKQMFINYEATEEQSNELVNDIISKTEVIINKNWEQIKKKYSKITKEDSKIISSYTCESKNKKFSPYKILNKNLVSEDRKEGLKNISKYLFILLKSLRKLDKYYPNEKEKYLYRCINSKVNLNYDIFNKKLVPYITGNTKTFWGFTSSSPDIKMTYNFLNGEENNKSGTIFTLTGKVWGYDITLFNYYNEKEILIEPERKYKIDEVIPPINDIIHIRCDIQDNPLILSENLDNLINENKINKVKDNVQKIIFDYLLNYILIGDNDSKSEILLWFSQAKSHLNTLFTVGFDYEIKNIEIRNKIYRIRLYATANEFITKTYFKNCVCIIIVYNITNRNSFDNKQKLIEDCKMNSPKSVSMVLVGNYAEKEDERIVGYDEGKSLADKYGMQFYEVSSKTGQNIDKLFFNITDKISKNIEDGFYDLNDKNCGIKKYNELIKFELNEHKKDNSICLII